MCSAVASPVSMVQQEEQEHLPSSQRKALSGSACMAGLLQQLLKAVDEGAAGAECLLAAAEAFPALAEAAGAPRWAALKPVLTALVLSGDEQVVVISEALLIRNVLHHVMIWSLLLTRWHGCYPSQSL